MYPTKYRTRYPKLRLHTQHKHWSGAVRHVWCGLTAHASRRLPSITAGCSDQLCCALQLFQLFFVHYRQNRRVWVRWLVGGGGGRFLTSLSPQLHPSRKIILKHMLKTQDLDLCKLVKRVVMSSGGRVCLKKVWIFLTDRRLSASEAGICFVDLLLLLLLFNYNWVDTRWQYYSTVQYSRVQYIRVQYSTV
jgi:hypothetical protein